VTAPAPKPDWARLFRVARALIHQVNARQSIIDRWTFGGGTAMMLQIEHRESRDVDIFLHDPQLLSYLDPAKHDFVFELQPTDYHGDGSRFLKIAFQDIGEIDFIVATELTSQPTIKKTVEGEAALLETIPEIITKKIHHRGASLTARDIFDIAAGAESHADPIIKALREYKADVAKTLETLEKLKPDFVKKAISQLAIKPKFQTIATTASERATEILRQV
jgi:hypothetical protein